MKRMLLTVLLLAVLLPAQVAAMGMSYRADKAKRVVIDTLYTVTGDIIELWREAPQVSDPILTFAGASVGSYVSGAGGDDVGAVMSYWSGVRVATISPTASWWLAYQHSENRALDTDGDGGKFILAVGHPEFPELSLLIGVGALDGFAVEGDGETTTMAFTGELGLYYEWAPGICGLGVMARAFDEGPEVGYTVDFGVVVLRPEELLLKLVGR